MTSEELQDAYKQQFLNCLRNQPIPNFVEAMVLSKKIVTCVRNLYTKIPAEKLQISISSTDNEIAQYFFHPVLHYLPHVDTGDGIVLVSLTTDEKKATDFSGAISIPEDISEDAFMMELETPGGKKKKIVYGIEDDILFPQKEKITLSNGKTMLVDTGEFTKVRGVLYYYDNKFRPTKKEIMVAISKIIGVNICDIDEKFTEGIKASTHRNQVLDNSNEVMAQKSVIKALQNAYDATISKLNTMQELIDKQQSSIDSTKADQPHKEVKIQLLQQSIEEKQKIVAEMDKSAKSILKDIEQELNILSTMQQQVCSRDEAISLLKS